MLKNNQHAVISHFQIQLLKAVSSVCFWQPWIREICYLAWKSRNQIVRCQHQCTKVVRVWRQYVKLSTQYSRLNILSRCVSHRQQENSLKEYSPSSEILQCNYRSIIHCCGLPTGLAHLQWADFSTYFLTSMIGQCPTHQFYSLCQMNEAMTLLTVSLSSSVMAQRSHCRACYKYSNDMAWQAAWLHVI